MAVAAQVLIPYLVEVEAATPCEEAHRSGRQQPLIWDWAFVCAKRYSRREREQLLGIAQPYVLVLVLLRKKCRNHHDRVAALGHLIHVRCHLLKSASVGSGCNDSTASSCTGVHALGKRHSLLA